MLLVIVDTAGIQSYIFGSNRLRENVGASYLVHMATEGWLLKEPNSFLPPNRHNIQNQGRNQKLLIENGVIDAELLYAGGGNTVLIFSDPKDVRAFGNALSKRLIQQAPGLDAVLIYREFDWKENLASVLLDAMQDLARTKQERERSQPLLGLGVTAACASTGLVANHHKPEPGEMPDRNRTRLSISSEVAAKWDSNDSAKSRLETKIPLTPGLYTYPDDFDHLGRTEGEQSYIGVVHADGNGMGKILEEITAKYAKGEHPDNRAYIEEVRAFSDAANEIGLRALRAVVEQVEMWNQRGEELDAAKERPRPGEMALLPGKRKIDKGQEESCISIRPIVFGGDDVTFVCDGRIALQTAKLFLEAFNQASQKYFPDRQVTACAGVAIVKSHYPFARAYTLAEELTKNAKNHYGRCAAALDWHLAQSGLFGDLDQIREEEYEFDPDRHKKRDNSSKRPTQTLLMRPLVVSAPDPSREEVTKPGGEWRTWDNFVKSLSEFQQSPQKSKKGRWPRNKVMELRTELAASRWDTERRSLQQSISQLKKSAHEMPTLPELTKAGSPYQDTGWANGEKVHRCVYYDAIEAIEQMVAYPSGDSTQENAAS